MRVFFIDSMGVPYAEFEAMSVADALAMSVARTALVGSRLVELASGRTLAVYLRGGWRALAVLSADESGDLPSLRGIDGLPECDGSAEPSFGDEFGVVVESRKSA
jgi:hypothetical protein